MDTSNPEPGTVLSSPDWETRFAKALADAEPDTLRAVCVELVMQFYPQWSFAPGIGQRRRLTASGRTNMDAVISALGMGRTENSA